MIRPLTSLRFFFALMVFFSHLSFVQTDWAFYNWLKRNIFFEGYLGVSFFFILSGFVLSYNYQEKLKAKSITKKEFYIARFARIYPLHILTLIFMGASLYINNQFSINTFFPNLFLVQSFIPLQEYYFSYNSPSWSISNEMFFYMLFPFLFFKTNKKGLFFIAIFFWILILGIFNPPPEIHKTIFYINPIVRLSDFMLGIILFRLYQSNRLISFFQKYAHFFEILACIIFLLFLSLHNYVDRGYRYSVYYWFPMLFIIWVFANQKGLISKILSLPFFVFLGEISFGFYMFHFLVITVGIQLKQYLYREIDDIVLAIFMLFCSLLISFAPYKWYEKPINQYIKSKLKK